MTELTVWAVGAFLVTVVLVLPRPSGLLWDNLFNAAHVALSSFVGLAGLRISRRWLPSLHRPWLRYLVALGLVAVIGGGLEVWQFVLPGTPALTDWVRDLLGGTAFVLAALSVDRRTIPSVSGSPTGRWILRGASVACLVVGLIPFLVTTGAAAFQLYGFPSLARFDSAWGRHFVQVGDGALLSIEPPPVDFVTARGTLVAKTVFTPKGEYPTLELTGPLGDWSTFRILAFEVYSPARKPVSLVLRVHDRQHRFEYGDRFNRALAILPGDNSISVSLDAVRAAPAGRRMDMAAIAAVSVFMQQPEEPMTLYFDDFRLER